MKKSVYNKIGIVLLVIGFLIVLGTRIDITGGFIGVPLNGLSNTIIGFVFIIVSILFMVGIRTPVTMNLVDKIDREISARDRPTCEILIDANFVKYIHSNGYKLNREEFGDYKVEIVDKVNAELKKRSEKTRQPLVSSETLCMLNMAGVNIWTEHRTKYKKDEKLEAQIFEYWEDYTPQGKMHRSHDSYEARQFRNSGDMEMLAYAVQKRGYTVIITDNYSEIGKIAEELNVDKKNMRIIVLGTKDVFRASL